MRSNSPGGILAPGWFACVPSCAGCPVGSIGNGRSKTTGAMALDTVLHQYFANPQRS